MYINVCLCKEMDIYSHKYVHISERIEGKSTLSNLGI